MRLTRFAAPPRFDALARRAVPWFVAAGGLLAVAGLDVGLRQAPVDAVQGEVYRILYLHVSAAWMAMLLYGAMAFWAAVGWIWHVRTASVLARAIAPTGALCTALCLATGAIWGHPTWGTWWVWDARLTSSLLLLMLYLAQIALQSAIGDPRRGDVAGAVLALAGLANLPVLYFSVQWWNTLHQGATIRLDGPPTMQSTMLLGLVLCVAAAWCLAAAACLARARILLREREAWRRGADPAAATPRTALAATDEGWA